MHRIRSVLLALLLLGSATTTSGCATIVGTAVSPITGGVDYALKHYPSNWLMTPLNFLAGAVAGPFRAAYNGLNYDAAIFRSFPGYWRNFGSVFRPFRGEHSVTRLGNAKD